MMPASENSSECGADDESAAACLENPDAMSPNVFIDNTQQLLAWFPSIPVLASQLEEASHQIEEAVVDVCADFQNILQKAQKAVAENPLLHADAGDGNSHEDASFESLVVETRSILGNFLLKNERSNEFSSRIAEKMRNLESQMNAVRESLLDIDGVAAKARLLALNGQIEAARAGDQGATFAIVAQETAKMAQHAAQSSKSIRKLIDDVASNVDEASGQLRDHVKQDSSDVVANKTEVNRMLDLMASLHGQMEREMSASHANCQSLAHDISKAVVAMQFQDAVKQRIGHVVRSLNEIFAVYRRKNGRGKASASPVNATSPQDWKKSLSKHYTMESERSTLAFIADHNATDGCSQDCNVELF